MAVDSRDKGKRGEYLVRDILRSATGLQWERVPGSGAFGQSHSLKGDIYLPPSVGKVSEYCFEVKWYKDDQISSNLFNIGESTLEKWWKQAVRESDQMNQKPALIFKKDKGKWLIALDSEDVLSNYIQIRTHMSLSKNDETNIIIGDFEAWLNSVKNKGVLVK